jgi:OmpA-OmpF porin, OOP family
MKSSAFTCFLLTILALPAKATPNEGVVGPYARVEVGQSHFSLSSAAPKVGEDRFGRAAKLFGGYRFNEHLGLEVGYAALGSLRKRVSIGGANLNQDAKARSIFAMATGRLPLGESLALHGRLGMSLGKVNGINILPASDNLIGSATSLVLGVGAEYKPLKNLALSVNFDDFGRLSKKVKASSLVFGVHFWF